MIRVGDRADVTRAFTKADVDRLVALGGTCAPGVVPEPLIGALFSYLLGVKLPGLGANYLKQQCEFVAPAPLGEPLTASVEVTRLRPDKRLVDLQTICRDASGTLVCEGRALIHAADVADAF